MAKKQIALEYNIPVIGWVGIIHAPGCEKGPYYARVDGYGIVAEKSGSEDEARVRVGNTINVLLGSKKTALEAQLSSVQSVLSAIQSSETPLGALSKYEVKD